MARRAVALNLTDEEQSKIVGSEMNSEGAIDLVFGAALGAYLGSSIDHSSFETNQAITLGGFLLLLWLFVFLSKLGARALAFRSIWAAIALLIVAGIGAWTSGYLLEYISAGKALFFRTVIFAWIISNVVSAMLITFSRGGVKDGIRNN